MHILQQCNMGQLSAWLPMLKSGGPTAGLPPAGGPVFNKDGHCVGIAFARYMDAEAVGYAIPPPIINHFLTDYK